MQFGLCFISLLLLLPLSFNCSMNFVIANALSNMSKCLNSYFMGTFSATLVRHESMVRAKLFALLKLLSMVFMSSSLNVLNQCNHSYALRNWDKNWWFGCWVFFLDFDELLRKMCINFLFLFIENVQPDFWHICTNNLNSFWLFISILSQ